MITKFRFSGCITTFRVFICTLRSKHLVKVQPLWLLLQELQQEKHGLHLELEKMEREYQNAIKDLQDDVASLQKQIQEGAEQQVVEKESSRFLREAQRNIDYLMEQIKKVTYHDTLCSLVSIQDCLKSIFALL